MTLYDWHNTSWDLGADEPEMALLPVGAIEQFGPHLPLDTQNRLLDVIARRVAERLPNRVYLLPTLPIGCSAQHQSFAGTVSLSWRTMLRVLGDLGQSLVATGVSRFVVLAGLGSVHCTTVMPWENEIVKTAVRRLNYDHPDLDAIWVQPLTVAQPSLTEIIPTARQEVHAGAVVTSLMQHLFPALVKGTSAAHLPDVADARYHYALPFASLCPDGVWGHPDQAVADRGEEMLSAIVEGTVCYVQDTFRALARITSRSDRFADAGPGSPASEG